VLRKLAQARVLADPLDVNTLWMRASPSGTEAQSMSARTAGKMRLLSFCAKATSSRHTGEASEFALTTNTTVSAWPIRPCRRRHHSSPGSVSSMSRNTSTPFAASPPRSQSAKAASLRE
jgi:hypothetical protein